MDLYREQDWSEERMQPLAGPADVTMTRPYLEGHEVRVSLSKWNNKQEKT
ncbi:MAG: hypothetical protein ISP90_08085 [Nevskia sp.]|nr:hypothetical protein [Nevskia sp.]